MTEIKKGRLIFAYLITFVGLMVCVIPTVLIHFTIDPAVVTYEGITKQKKKYRITDSITNLEGVVQYKRDTTFLNTP